MATIADYLDACYREEFARVVSAWTANDVVRRVKGLGGYYEARKDGVVLRLVNDRGCVSCEVGADDGTNDFVDVELLAQVLDHLGKKGPPTWTESRRLSLADQCSLLIERKEEIVDAVATPRWQETRELAAAIGRDRFHRRAKGDG